MTHRDAAQADRDTCSCSERTGRKESQNFHQVIEGCVWRQEHPHSAYEHSSVVDSNAHSTCSALPAGGTIAEIDGSRATAAARRHQYCRIGESAVIRRRTPQRNAVVGPSQGFCTVCCTAAAASGRISCERACKVVRGQVGQWEVLTQEVSACLRTATILGEHRS